MERTILILVVSILLTSCGPTYYVVRHAEKAQSPSTTAMDASKDPPLSSEGLERAVALKEVLKNKHIHHIFSTNTNRTTSTAAPLSTSIGVNIVLYSQVDRAFISKLKAIRKNTLVVGHSNTVDDIIQQLTGNNYLPADLPDSAYNNLFIIKKKGKRMTFKATTYGAPAH